jgi:hypothetical protein
LSLEKLNPIEIANNNGRLSNATAAGQCIAPPIHHNGPDPAAEAASPNTEGSINNTPNLFRSPAIGRIAIGKTNALPICCKKSKVLAQPLSLFDSLRKALPFRSWTLSLKVVLPFVAILISFIFNISLHKFM